jgi:hypothetical protein
MNTIIDTIGRQDSPLIDMLFPHFANFSYFYIYTGSVWEIGKVSDEPG